tara:strand:+ start:1156 stop:1584 length:429 start_codon:yes stop_codon:yes gene_type:complete
MEDFFGSFIGKSIRWLFFIPLSLISGLLAKLCIAWARYDAWSEYMIEIIPTHIISNGVETAVSVYVCYLIVPNYRTLVTRITTSILLLFPAFSLIMSAFRHPMFIEIPFLPETGYIDEVSLLGMITSVVVGVYSLIYISDFD